MNGSAWVNFGMNALILNKKLGMSWEWNGTGNKLTNIEWKMGTALIESTR
jgi:hypothetical protein